MAKDVTFFLDTAGAGDIILQNMAAQTGKLSAESIAQRANSIGAAMDTDNAPTFEVYSNVGTIKKGRRAISTVKANANNQRSAYIARQALRKAIDAGRLK